MSQEMENRLEQLEREKHQIQRALALKKLKGSVVWERVDCHSPPRRCCPHGPYAYLHYYDARSGKVKRKYLGKNVELLSWFEGELQQRLREIEGEERKILGTSLTREKRNIYACMHAQGVIP